MSKLPILGKYAQAPEDRKRYTFDYSEWLDEGETVVSCTSEISPITTAPLLIESLTNGNTVATWLLSGGEHLTDYLVVIEAETSAGQRIRQAMAMKVIDYTPEGA